MNAEEKNKEIDINDVHTGTDPFVFTQYETDRKNKADGGSYGAGGEGCNGPLGSVG